MLCPQIGSICVAQISIRCIRNLAEKIAHDLN